MPHSQELANLSARLGAVETRSVETAIKVATIEQAVQPIKQLSDELAGVRGGIRVLQWLIGTAIACAGLCIALIRMHGG